MDWGNVPSWVGVVGAMATLGLSVRVTWVQVLDRRQEQEDRRAAQARSVTAWVEDVKNDGGVVAVVLVRNSSEQAIYALTVSLDVSVRGRYVKQRNALGPGESARLELRLAGFPRGELAAPTIAFTDAGGLSWIRTAAGELRHPVESDRTDYLAEHAGSFESIDGRNAAANRWRGADEEA